jgi:hypothetical protein
METLRQYSPLMIIVASSLVGPAAASQLPCNILKRPVLTRSCGLHLRTCLLPYITNLGVARQLLRLGVHLEVFLKALWKHVIIVEILRHRYDVTTPEQKLNMLQAFRERFKRDPAKMKALDYLDEFGDKFWCEADERVKQIAESFERKISASGGITVGAPGLGVKASGDVEQRNTQEVQWETLTSPHA